MSKKIIKTIFILLSVVLGSCYYDKEEILYPGSVNCTVPTASTFSIDVLPLPNNQCNNCHGGSSPSAGIALTNHAQVMNYVNNGSLMGSINHASGYSAMPKNSGKMSNCEIQKIQLWIDSGAINN